MISGLAIMNLSGDANIAKALRRKCCTLAADSYECYELNAAKPWTESYMIDLDHNK